MHRSLAILATAILAIGLTGTASAQDTAPDTTNDKGAGYSTNYQDAGTYTSSARDGQGSTGHYSVNEKAGNIVQSGSSHKSQSGSVKAGKQSTVEGMLSQD
jgi:hypothetical protein